MINTGIEFSTIKTLSEILNIDYANTTVTERAKIRYDYIMEQRTQGNRDEFWDNLELIPGARKIDPIRLPPWRTDKTIVSTSGCCGTDIKGKLVTYEGSIDGKGYSMVVVRSPTMSFRVTTHRAVASTFIAMKSFDQTLVVNHRDTIKTNNDISNLEWVTQQRNNQHALELGIRIGINNKATKPVLGTWIIPDEDYGTTFVLVGKTNIFASGLDPATVREAVDNPTMTRYGCIWEYVPKEEVPLFYNGIPDSLKDKIKDLPYTNMNTEPVKGTINLEGKHKGETFCVYGKARLEELGFKQPNIYKVYDGKLKTHGGCKWERVSREQALLLQRDPTSEQLEFLFRKGKGKSI